MAYFQPYNDYFWQWEEQHSVISIPGESTIAYTDYVAEVIKVLAHQGLPPFGSLLLAIVATNPRALPSLEEIQRIITDQLQIDDTPVIAEAMSFLHTLHGLPEAYKSGPKRLLVFQTIFADCHYKMAITKSRMQLGVIMQRNFPKRTDAKAAFHKTHFSQDFRVVGLLNKRFPTPLSIINKIAGLPEIDEELILEESSQKPPEVLVDELIDNAKTFHVGSLVKRIWSGLNIPVHSSLPSQQPLGGFSDLSNKGDFDKLLLSEFANDDLLFLTRLANNEALYIQREVPPESNRLERVILIDVSLKNWGTPKTIAFATMLAIAKHPKTTIRCKAYVIGNDFHAVSADSVHGIIEGLQIVEGGLHPARGLDAFFKHHPSSAHREVFFITEPSTLKQGGMLKAMQDYQPLIHYLIYTDAEGNIDVYKKQQNSKKHLQHLLLPLQTLWKKPSSKTPTPKAPADSRDLIRPDFPLLVKSPANVKFFLSTPDGELFVVTSDRYLLRIYKRDANYYEKGWEVLYERLPVLAGEFEVGMLEDKSYALLMFDPQTRTIHLLNLSSGSCIKIPFPHWKSSTPSFLFKDGAFFYRTYAEPGWCIHADGRVGETEAPGLNYFKDRQEERRKLSARASPSGSALKNIDTVYIDTEGRLVINIHALRLNHSNHLVLSPTSNPKKKAATIRKERDNFVFPDGSEVIVSRAGLVILKSSNPVVPPVYLPTLVDVSLGVASDAAFAGNTYYYREPLYEVRLRKAGSNKLGLIKEIKAINNESLLEVKNLVETAPGSICRYVSHKRGLEIRQKLETEGTETELVNMTDYTPAQQVLETQEFFRMYIQPFIDTITAYGA